MTLTPDGKTAYVANPVTNDVSVVDVANEGNVANQGRVRAEAQRDRDAAVTLGRRLSHRFVARLATHLE